MQYQPVVVNTPADHKFRYVLPGIAAARADEVFRIRHPAICSQVARQCAKLAHVFNALALHLQHTWRFQSPAMSLPSYFNTHAKWEQIEHWEQEKIPASLFFVQPRDDEGSGAWWVGVPSGCWLWCCQRGSHHLSIRRRNCFVFLAQRETNTSILANFCKKCKAYTYHRSRNVGRKISFLHFGRFQEKTDSLPVTSWRNGDMPPQGARLLYQSWFQCSRWHEQKGLHLRFQLRVQPECVLINYGVCAEVHEGSEQGQNDIVVTIVPSAVADLRRLRTRLVGIPGCGAAVWALLQIFWFDLVHWLKMFAYQRVQFVWFPDLVIIQVLLIAIQNSKVYHDVIESECYKDQRGVRPQFSHFVCKK